MDINKKFNTKGNYKEPLKSQKLSAYIQRDDLRTGISGKVKNWDYKKSDIDGFGSLRLIFCCCSKVDRQKWEIRL